MTNPEIRQPIIKRLHVIEGHLRAVAEMIENDRSCEEVLTQMKAISSSLNKAKHMIVKNYLTECVATENDLGDHLELVLKLLDR